MPYLQGTSANICTNLTLPETIAIWLHFAADSMDLIFIQLFVAGSEKHVYFKSV